MAGVNPFDLITISGTRKIKPLPHIAGVEASGEKIREHVSRLKSIYL
jgi:NADPH:quinone reductase-like Zn-dependent oxidoreductase